MKLFKLILILALSAHISVMLVVNFFYFPNNKWQFPEDKLNKFGATVFGLKVNENESLLSFTTMAGKFLGTSKPFEFFSPNIADYWTELIFVGSNNGQEVRLLRSIEGKSRMIAFGYHFQTLHRNQEISKSILNSMAKSIFTDYPGVRKIQVKFKSKAFVGEDNEVLTYNILRGDYVE